MLAINPLTPVMSNVSGDNFFTAGDYMILRVTVFISILASMAGCATPQISLTKQTQGYIESADSVLFIPQNNLDVTVTRTQPVGGLIGALVLIGIDSWRQSIAEKNAAPIIQQLQNYDFRTVMLNILTAETPKIVTIKFRTPSRLETIYSESQKRISFDQSSSSVVMFTTVGYRLESGNLYVISNVEMYPKSESLFKFRNKPNDSNPIDNGNVIYRKMFSFTRQAVTADNIKDSLGEGASSITKQIVADLNHPL
ncbi:MAG: hypothetical protein NTX45_01955 [Proteobacteria bacterium]|nr:hypothetical protein [Pseudomonadota bacterium]